MLHGRRERQLRSRLAWPKLTIARTLLGTLVCFIVAWLAQTSLDRYQGRSTPVSLLSLLLLAGLGFAILCRDVASEISTSVSFPEQQSSTISFSTLTAALALSALGCLDFGHNLFRPKGVLLWVLGLALALLYLWLISPGDAGSGPRRACREWGRLWLPAHALILLAIVLLGAWFRLHLNGVIPAEMGFDLASKYFDALSIARGQYHIFFPARLGREGLFFYSVALVGRLSGINKGSLHLTSALFGVAAIVAVYALAQEAFGRRAGLLAAFLLAVNRWHIVLSRTGFRAATMPLFTALALYAFIRALRTRRPLDFGWTGVALGAGVYSYRSFLFVPVAMLIGLLFYLLPGRLSQFRLLFPGLLAAALVAAAIAAPLVRYALEYPDKYLARERYQLQAMNRQQERSPGLLAYLVRSLLAFNYRGEADARFNVPYARHMGLASGVLLVSGLAYALWRWRHGYNAVLVSSLFVLVLPASLSMLPDEMASALRLCGAIVPAVALAAVPLTAMGQIAKPRQKSASVNEQQTAGPQRLALGQSAQDQVSAAGLLGVSLTVHVGRRQRACSWSTDWGRLAGSLAILLAVLLLAYETAEARNYYFHDYVRRLPEMSNYSMPQAIAREIQAWGDLQSVYIPVWPNWFDSGVLQLHVGTGSNWNPFVAALAPDQPPLATFSRPALFVLNPNDRGDLETLNAAYPRGLTKAHYYPNGELAFYTFYAEP